MEKQERPLDPEARLTPAEGRTPSPAQRLYHGIPHSRRVFPNELAVFDNDLAEENLENDIPQADLQ